MKTPHLLYPVFLIILCAYFSNCQSPVDKPPFPCEGVEETDSLGVSIYKKVLGLEKELIADGYLAKDGSGYVKLFEQMQETGDVPIKGNYQIEGMQDRSPSIIFCLIQYYWQSHPDAAAAESEKWSSLQQMEEANEMDPESTPKLFADIFLTNFSEEDFKKEVNKIPVLLLFYATIEPEAIVKLPPWSDDPDITKNTKERNVLSVLVNEQNEVLVRGEPLPIGELKETAKAFILNPEGKDDLAEDPKKAIISLKNDRGTSYDVYLAVYNELRSAYLDLWNEEAARRFNKDYEYLSHDEKKQIRSTIPLIIAEAEPTSFGE